jgi:hypothetical protein
MLLWIRGLALKATEKESTLCLIPCENSRQNIGSADRQRIPLDIYKYLIYGSIYGAYGIS